MFRSRSVTAGPFGRLRAGCRRPLQKQTSGGQLSAVSGHSLSVRTFAAQYFGTIIFLEQPYFGKSFVWLRKFSARSLSKVEGESTGEYLLKRLIIGLSGASGIIYGIRLLEVLQNVEDVETHLVMSAASRRTLKLETDYSIAEVEALADTLYNFNNIAAAISSGSYKTIGMVVIPCSIKTLSGITHSYSDNLLLRAADVVLKDRRKLVLALRETPLHAGHIRLMAQVTEMGAIIMPPTPAFYHHPKSLDDIINQTVNRLLDIFDIDLPQDLFQRWDGDE